MTVASQVVCERCDHIKREHCLRCDICEACELAHSLCWEFTPPKRVE